MSAGDEGAIGAVIRDLMGSFGNSPRRSIGIPPGATHSPPWHSLYRRHVARVNGAGHPAADGPPPPPLPSEESDQVFWVVVKAPPSSRGRRENRAPSPASPRLEFRDGDVVALGRGNDDQGLASGEVSEGARIHGVAGPAHSAAPAQNQPPIPHQQPKLRYAQYGDSNEKETETQEPEAEGMSALQDNDHGREVDAKVATQARKDDAVPAFPAVSFPSSAAAPPSSPVGPMGFHRSPRLKIPPAARCTVALHADGRLRHAPSQHSSEAATESRVPARHGGIRCTPSARFSTLAEAIHRKDGSSRVPNGIIRDENGIRGGAARAAFCSNARRNARDHRLVVRERGRLLSNPLEPVPVPTPKDNNVNDNSYNNKARAARRAAKLKNTKRTASAARKKYPPRAKPPQRCRSPSEGDMTEARRTHMMVCASCQATPSLDEVVGLCQECPRTFCSGCLGSDVEVGTENGQHGSAFLPFHSDDRNGDSAATLELSIRKCSSCASGSDVGFPPPPPGVSPKVHLLEELLKHGLSWCFRAPVDVEVYGDYLRVVGRTAMMDLSTMVSNMKRCRYRGHRGCISFYHDLGRIWRNCRVYAGCDAQGQPLLKTASAPAEPVPGIVRCAFILETMTKRFVLEHMPADELSPEWHEPAWDPSSNRAQSEQACEDASQLGLEGGRHVMTTNRGDGPSR